MTEKNEHVGISGGYEPTDRLHSPRTLHALNDGPMSHIEGGRPGIQPVEEVEMTVLVFLNDDYADWELGYVLPEVAAPAADASIKKNRQTVRTFSLDGKAVSSMGGLRVVPDHSLAQVADAEMQALILPGGTFWHDLESDPLRNFVIQRVERGVCVAAICAATGFLARLRVLDGVLHTSNSLSFLKAEAPHYQGESMYRDEPAVHDRNIVTAGGLGAVDFSRKLLEILEVYEPSVIELWYRAFKYGENPFAGRQTG